MNGNLIYDVGMHNGDDTAYYLSLGYDVVSIEASPDMSRDAGVKFKEEIKNNRLTILNQGIGKISGFCEFYLNKSDSVWNSFDKDLGSRGGKGFDIIKIKTNTLAEIISQFGCPYYLKIDIEGYDIFCLESLLTSSERPSYISVELSQVEIIHKLRKLGYDQFKIIEQTSFLNLEFPVSDKYISKLRYQRFQYSMNLVTRAIRKLFGRSIKRYFEKKFVSVSNYQHTFGSSGTFGKHLPGNWLSFENAIQVFNYYSQNGKKISGCAAYEFWADIHATKSPASDIK